MDEEKPISRFVQGFVARKLSEIDKQASKGTGLYYELYAQNFTDAVDRLAALAKRSDLKRHILAEAEKTGNYFPEEAHLGRWDYDHEAGDLVWKGEPLDWMKQVDFKGQWVRKSADERVRYVTGYFGEDSRTQKDYPGIQIEKNGVVGPVKWGPKQPDGQEAQEYAENMLDGHLGFAAPRIEPASIKDIMKRQELSERLGAKVLSKEYKKYIKQSAAIGEGAARKYGSNEPPERELPPPKRSR